MLTNKNFQVVTRHETLDKIRKHAVHCKVSDEIFYRKMDASMDWYLTQFQEMCSLFDKTAEEGGAKGTGTRVEDVCSSLKATLYVLKDSNRRLREEIEGAEKLARLLERKDEEIRMLRTQNKELSKTEIDKRELEILRKSSKVKDEKIEQLEAEKKICERKLHEVHEDYQNKEIEEHSKKMLEIVRFGKSREQLVFDNAKLETDLKNLRLETEAIDRERVREALEEKRKTENHYETILRQVRAAHDKIAVEMKGKIEKLKMENDELKELQVMAECTTKPKAKGKLEKAYAKQKERVEKVKEIYEKEIKVSTKSLAIYKIASAITKEELVTFEKLGGLEFDPNDKIQIEQAELRLYKVARIHNDKALLSVFRKTKGSGSGNRQLSAECSLYRNSLALDETCTPLHDVNISEYKFEEEDLPKV